MERFEEYLRRHLPTAESFHPDYNEALQMMLKAGGKRFRPALLLGVVEAYTPMLYDAALPVALGVEIFHTYSLIHDDLPAMDNADLRRGHETIHKRFDETTAILVGDALNTEAFLRIAEAPLREDVKVALIRLLAQAGGATGMVLGQAIDCRFENTPLSVEQIRRMHIDKTAKLIAASLRMGAVIAGCERALQERLYDFGLRLGLLFQIQDDIIDATQSTEQAGKDTGVDNTKNSFVTRLGLETAMREADSEAKALEAIFESFDVPLREALSPVIRPYLYRHTKDA